MLETPGKFNITMYVHSYKHMITQTLSYAC